MEFTKEDFYDITDYDLTLLFKNFEVNKPIDAHAFAQVLGYSNLVEFERMGLITVTGDMDEFEKNKEFWMTHDVTNYKPAINAYSVTITNTMIEFKNQRDAYYKSLGGGTYPQEFVVNG